MRRRERERPERRAARVQKEMAKRFADKKEQKKAVSHVLHLTSVFYFDSFSFFFFFLHFHFDASPHPENSFGNLGKRNKKQNV